MAANARRKGTSRHAYYPGDPFTISDGLFCSPLNCTAVQPELQYNIALCFYKTKQYGDSLRFLAEIIERGVREHPELSVGRYERLGGVCMCGNVWGCRAVEVKTEGPNAPAACVSFARKCWW